MKKLIMFVMLLAMASPSLGVYEGDLVDVRPEIDTSGGVTTAVFDFATEPERMNDFTGETNPAACIDPDVGYYMMPIFEDGEWADGVLSSAIWYSVEVPEGGDYVTIRVQCHIAEGEDPTVAPEVYEYQLQDCVPTAVDMCNFEIVYFSEESNWEYPDNANVAIWQETVARSDWTETIVAAGGFLPLAPYVGLIVDVIVHDTEEPPSGARESECFVYYGPLNPLKVDPNSPMTVYETGPTESAFAVSLNYPPVGQGPDNQGEPYTIEVTIDPNGGNGGYGEGGLSDKDIVLLDGTGIDNQLVLTFNTTNWDVPQRVFFRAINDSDAEPPELIEITDVGVTITSVVAEPNLNGGFDAELNPWEAGDPKWSKNQAVPVLDNNQADILLSYSAVYTSGGGPTPEVPVLADTSVRLWEQLTYSYGVGSIQKRNIGVTLQVAPDDGDPCTLVDTVKLLVAIEGDIVGDNFPLTDPCLPFAEIDEPNGLIFTSANFDTVQKIKIWGNDDDALQAEGAAADGDQNYNVSLIVTVVDGGGDERYQWIETELSDPCDPYSIIETEVSLERIIVFDIEDNECGALGISAMDVSNPYYLMDEETLGGDPNDWMDEDGNPTPDCYVDLNDVIEMAKQWLNCSDPQVMGCENLND